MKALLLFLDQRSTTFIVLFCMILLASVAVADIITGPQLSSAIFYALPVSLLAWYAGRWPGLAMAIAGAGLWYIADHTAGDRYSHSIIPVWNAFTRLGFFVVLVYLLTAFHNLLREAQQRAVTDSLTGIANHRAFYEAAERESSRARRYHHPFSLAYIDVDDFKHINDAYGHATGDRLLQSAARTMRESIRETDLLARLGGDEFAILFVETDATAAKRRVEELREKLLAAMRREEWPVTFSIGVMTYESPPADIRGMISAADQLMYSVKRGGKNGFAHAMGEAPALTGISRSSRARSPAST